MTTHISPKEVSQKQCNGESLVILDVRSTVEFREVHVPHAVNLPLEKVSVEAVRELAESTPVYVICKSGQRAAKACERLIGDPLLHVELIDGGTEGWITAGLEVVRGKKSMSLERQVRLTAGLLVFTGTVVGYFTHPLGFLISGGVGAGLAIAAIIDTCAMGMVLARMPWNRV